MGRLTIRNVFNKALCKKNGTKHCYDADECLYCKYNNEILEKLAHYEDMEEQGRLIELPCAVGDTIWRIKTEQDHPDERPYNIIAQTKFRLDFLSAMGEAMFATKEEAEAKLKELSE